MHPALERPKLWQIALALLVGAFVATQSAKADRAAVRLLQEGTHVEARILSAKEGRRGGTPTVCWVEFSFLLPDGTKHHIRDSAPSAECRIWERQLVRGQTPTAGAVYGRDGVALLLAEAQARSANLAKLPPWLRLVATAGAILLISMVIRAYLPPRD